MIARGFKDDICQIFIFIPRLNDSEIATRLSLVKLNRKWKV
jgi:hypothetical protein